MNAQLEESMPESRTREPGRRVRAGVIPAFVGLGAALGQYVLFFVAWAVLDGHAAFGRGAPPSWATALHTVLSFPLLWLAPAAAVERFFGVLTVSNSVLWGAAAVGLLAIGHRSRRAGKLSGAA